MYLEKLKNIINFTVRILFYKSSKSIEFSPKLLLLMMGKLSSMSSNPSSESRFSTAGTGGSSRPERKFWRGVQRTKERHCKYLSIVRFCKDFGIMSSVLFSFLTSSQTVILCAFRNLSSNSFLVRFTLQEAFSFWSDSIEWWDVKSEEIWRLPRWAAISSVIRCLDGL